MSDADFQKQRISIGLAIGENPPWTNLKFTCECGAEYQLGCADELKPKLGTFGFLTPPCWNCGKVNIVYAPRPARPDSQPEGNPS